MGDPATNMPVVGSAARSPSTQLFWAAVCLGEPPCLSAACQRQPALPCRALAMARTGGASDTPRGCDLAPHVVRPWQGSRGEAGR